MRTASLRRRVSLASLLVLATALLAFDAFLYVSFSDRLTGDLRSQLTERAQLARTLASSLPPQELADRLGGGDVTARVTKNGHSYVAHAAPAGPPPGHARLPKAGGAATGRPAAPPRAALKAIPAGTGSLTVAQPLPGGERLVLSASRAQIDGELAGLLALEVVGTLVVLLLAALTLGRILGRALEPLDRTTAVAAEIARGGARERLAPERTDTELGRLAAEFDAMLDRLEQALGSARASEERMREFLGDAAHELRTPIQAIQAGAESLLRSAGEGPDRERLIIRMIRDSARSGRLVADLLTLNRLDHVAELQRDEIDLAALAREHLARAEVLAPGLRLYYAGPLRCPVRADRDRLSQVIVNLLDNARHATPDGGTVALGLETDGDWIELSVADSGPGVAAADRERVFGRFVRLDSSRSRNAFGSGLGLAIARQIARAHGGDLICTGAPSAGARFELRLPTGARPAQASAPPEPQPRSAPSTRSPADSTVSPPR